MMVSKRKRNQLRDARAISQTADGIVSQKDNLDAVSWDCVKSIVKELDRALDAADLDAAKDLVEELRGIVNDNLKVLYRFGIDEDELADTRRFGSGVFNLASAADLDATRRGTAVASTSVAAGNAASTGVSTGAAEDAGTDVATDATEKTDEADRTRAISASNARTAPGGRIPAVLEGYAPDAAAKGASISSTMVASGDVPGKAPSGSTSVPPRRAAIYDLSAYGDKEDDQAEGNLDIEEASMEGIPSIGDASLADRVPAAKSASPEEGALPMADVPAVGILWHEGPCADGASELPAVHAVHDPKSTPDDETKPDDVPTDEPDGDLASEPKPSPEQGFASHQMPASGQEPSTERESMPTLIMATPVPRVEDIDRTLVMPPISHLADKTVAMPVIFPPSEKTAVMPAASQPLENTLVMPAVSQPIEKTLVMPPVSAPDAQTGEDAVAKPADDVAAKPADDTKPADDAVAKPADDVKPADDATAKPADDTKPADDVAATIEGETPVVTGRATGLVDVLSDIIHITMPKHADRADKVDGYWKRGK